MARTVRLLTSAATVVTPQAMNQQKKDPAAQTTAKQLKVKIFGVGSAGLNVVDQRARPTFPFDCEGNRRQRQAQQGLQELKATADGVICLPNQKLFRLIDEQTSVRDTFKLSNELLAEGVVNLWRLIVCKGLIEIHFADLC